MTARVLVVGAGIVGLATAHALAQRGRDVVVLDKEARLAAHQTGRNSGVVHSGVYYAPGSLKASMSARGATSMIEFARSHGVQHDACGKLLVATDDRQLARLRDLEQRAVANRVPARWLGPSGVAEHEPHVRARAALRVETTAVVDYVGVCAALRSEIEAAGGEVRLGAAVRAVRAVGSGVTVETDSGDVTGSYLVNCAGLHSDSVARMAGLAPDVRILPFRGEYLDVTGPSRDLVRGLVYPVPDPALPFLGVHLTRGHDGSVHAGPNAVLALAREGYRWRDVDLTDVREELTWPGTWRLARRYWRVAGAEVARSASLRLFLRSAQQLAPALRAEDLVRAAAGVRAQAVRRDGSLVDDFLVQEAPRQLHVLNAPSPAATAALEIGSDLARRVVRALTAR